jgi:hypothetical protein
MVRILFQDVIYYIHGYINLYLICDNHLKCLGWILEERVEMDDMVVLSTRKEKVHLGQQF